ELLPHADILLHGLCGQQLGRILAQIRTQLGKMTASQQMLLGSLAVIMVMGLFLMSQYAGRAQMAELMPTDDAGQTLAALESAGIEAENRNGQIFVPPASRRLALAQLSQRGMLPNDTTILFSNLIEKQSWSNSRTQNEQLFNIALQNELGRLISLWDGIERASVLMDVPEPNGIGRIVRRPTASATVFTGTGRQLTQKEVDAIAGFVSGARAGLMPTDVRVIDGANGRQRRPTDESSTLPTTYIEHTAAVERDLRTKLSDMLVYIPGVIVAVTAQVDVTSVSERRQENLAINQGTLSLPRKESRTEQSTIEASNAGEPGVRSNTGADISRGSGGGPTNVSTQEDIEFENAVGSSVRQIVDPRGYPTRLAASVGVPEGYIRMLLDRARPAPAEGEEPTPISQDEIQARFLTERDAIAKAIRPHVVTLGPGGEMGEGDVVVTLLPMDLPPGSTPQQAGVLGGLGGLIGSGDGNLWAQGGMVDTIVLAVLAVAALGMMVMMVRRAGKKITLPTPEELVGIPPALEHDGEIIGEADESESAMTGIEVGDGVVQADKVRDEVVSLVTQDASQAANLLTRWINEEE
ncbi:MAG: flagellar M-ring protein FliF C-terminal domain-containing protein, partial [Planctomycetota bacterium]